MAGDNTRSRRWTTGVGVNGINHTTENISIFLPQPARFYSIEVVKRCKLVVRKPSLVLFECIQCILFHLSMISFSVGFIIKNLYRRSLQRTPCFHLRFKALGLTSPKPKRNENIAIIRFRRKLAVSALIQHLSTSSYKFF